MNSSILLAVLALIEQVLELIGAGNKTVTLIENIINTLTRLMPLIEDEVSVVYQAVKGIIIQLRNSGEVTPKQLEDLNALDTKVDNAWNSVEAQLDPDAT